MPRELNFPSRVADMERDGCLRNDHPPRGRAWRRPQAEAGQQLPLGYAALYSEALARAIKAGLTSALFDDLVRSSRMHCAFYDTFIGWVASGDSQSDPFALDDALRTISDVAQLPRSVGLNGSLASGVRELYAQAIADGFGASMLPELPHTVAKANNIDLRPASECAPS